jgi:hypothetical protein
LCSLRSLFLGCSSLSNLAIPNSVVEIGIRCSINFLTLQNFTIFLQNIPRIQNRWNDKVQPFHYQGGSNLFVKYLFHSSQLTL